MSEAASAKIHKVFQGNEGPSIVISNVDSRQPLDKSISEIGPKDNKIIDTVPKDTPLTHAEEMNHSKTKMNLSKCSRYLSFVVLITINLFINMDDGTIPAATNQIENWLNITSSELGLFGSLVYIGSLIGKIIY